MSADKQDTPAIAPLEEPVASLQRVLEIPEWKLRVLLWAYEVDASKRLGHQTTEFKLTALAMAAGVAMVFAGMKTEGAALIASTVSMFSWARAKTKAGSK